MKYSVTLLTVLVLFACFSTPVVAQVPRVQAIHNVADPELEILDVYIVLLGSVFDVLQDQQFKTGSPFINAITVLTIDFGIAPGNSESVDDTVRNFPVVFTESVPHYGVLSGVLNPAGFAPNPDGRDIAMDRFIIPNAREEANSDTDVDLMFLHGATDLGSVTLNIRDGDEIGSGLTYGDNSEYISLTPGMHVLEVTDGGGGETCYNLDLTDHAGSAMLVMFTGFVDPAANQNGAPLSLAGFLPTGESIQFAAVECNPVAIEAGTAMPSEFSLAQNYPNPFNPETVIRYSLRENSVVSLKIYDVRGTLVKTALNNQRSTGNHEYTWDGRNDAGKPVASGVYLYRLDADGFAQTKKMMLVR